MRLVKILISEQQREAVLSVLDDDGIDYLLVDAAGTETGADELLIEFPLPDQAVEHIRERLTETGVDEEYVVTLAAESARTERFDELENRFITGTERGDSISPEELRSTALSLHPDPLPYYLMTVISALVAVAGLLIDSAALVVGAMVIAPQVGSALTASIGATMADWGMLKRGLRAQILSLSLAVAGAVVFSITMQSLGFISPTIEIETIAEVGERTSPGVLTLAVGIAAGIAGALGLATALPVSIVGVMIAAALIPAAAATGIGIAWNDPSVAMGAAVLLVANIVSVNVAGFLTLRRFGYRSVDDEAAQLPTAGAVLVGTALVAAVIVSGGLFVAQASFEKDVNDAVEGTLDEEEYSELELRQVRVDFVFVPGSPPPDVRIVVQRPVDESYPQLATDLAEAIGTTTDREVTVRLEFTDSQQSDTNADSAFAEGSYGGPERYHRCCRHATGTRVG